MKFDPVLFKYTIGVGGISSWITVLGFITYNHFAWNYPWSYFFSSEAIRVNGIGIILGVTGLWISIVCIYLSSELFTRPKKKVSKLKGVNNHAD